jgi:tetratricopeptide (TPR) repeat protein
VRAERRARRLTVGLAVAVLAVVVSLTVGGMWLQRQQAEESRQAEALRREVGAVIEQAIHFRQGAHFKESRELLEQARQRLGADGPADLRAQVDQALADTALARRLDAARLRALTETAGGDLDFAGAQKEYAAALKEAGLGQEGEDAGVVAARVQASGVRAEVVAALDHWAGIAGDGPRRTWLLAVARAADPDPERDRLRQPALWRAGAASARLAADARVAELSPQVVGALGRALFLSGGDPIPLLRKAQARHPNDVWLNTELAGTLHEAKQWDEAIVYYRVALALRPGAAIQTSLGLALYDKGKLDEAIEHCEEVIRINPTYGPAHLNLGMALCAKDRLDEGIRHFNKALRLGPDYAKAHYNLGIALQTKGRLDQAVDHCKEAIRLAPRSAMAHFSLGNVLQAQRRFGEAIAQYEQALHINHRYAAAHTNLGAALYAQGKVKEAVSHFEQAIRLDQKEAMAHVNLGKAFADRGQLDAAIGHYEEALHHEPQNALVHYNLGLALKAKGRLDDAIGHYNEALRIKPGDAAAHTNLGNALKAKGFLGEAISQYDAALSIDRNNVLARFNLAITLHDKGTPDKAVHHFEEILRIDPSFVMAHAGRGQALLALGRLAEARDAMRRCLAMLPPRHPGGPVVMEQLHRCERLLVLEGRLPAILSGKDKPAGAAGALDFGIVCLVTQRHADAVRLYADAFADPTLAEHKEAAHRFRAACCAALAAAALKPNDKEQPRLRRQALGWLRADLALWEKQTEIRNAMDCAKAHRFFWIWQNHPGLASVRDREGLVMLPDQERKDWQAFWADVEALRMRVRESK